MTGVLRAGAGLEEGRRRAGWAAGLTGGVGAVTGFGGGGGGARRAISGGGSGGASGGVIQAADMTRPWMATDRSAAQPRRSRRVKG